MEWDPIEDAESYLVYTSESPISESDLPGLTPVSEGLSTSLMQSLKNGTYYYVVVAVAEWMASNTSISNVIRVFVVIHPKVVEPTQPDEAPSQDYPNPEREKGVNGYLLTMIGGTIGIIGVIALVGKRRRIET